jgi:hypothetical protein
VFPLSLIVAPGWVIVLTIMRFLLLLLVFIAPLNLSAQKLRVFHDRFYNGGFYIENFDRIIRSNAAVYDRMKGDLPKKVKGGEYYEETRHFRFVYSQKAYDQLIEGHSGTMYRYKATASYRVIDGKKIRVVTFHEMLGRH